MNHRSFLKKKKKKTIQIIRSISSMEFFSFDTMEKKNYFTLDVSIRWYRLHAIVLHHTEIHRKHLLYVGHCQMDALKTKQKRNCWQKKFSRKWHFSLSFLLKRECDMRLFSLFFFFCWSLRYWNVASGCSWSTTAQYSLFQFQVSIRKEQMVSKPWNIDTIQTEVGLTWIYLDFMWNESKMKVKHRKVKLKTKAKKCLSKLIDTYYK